MTFFQEVFPILEFCCIALFIALFRFSWYRQSVGGLYFVSVKNMFYTVRQIKCVMLLREGVNLCQLTCTKEKQVLEEDIQKVRELLHDDMQHFDDLSQMDADIIYSVAGYVTNAVNCSCFEPPVFQQDSSYFEAMSRGGWTVPQPCVLFICTVATSAFNILVKRDKRDIFLRITNHRSAFVAAVQSLLVFQIPSLQSCSHVHRILSIFFNCLSKNFLKGENDIYDRCSFRRIRKLLSRCK